MQKISLWGSLASIIALGIAIIPFGARSTGDTGSQIQTHGANSPAIGVGEAKGDITVSYGKESQQTSKQDQTVIVSVNIDGRVLPFTAPVIEKAANKTKEVQLPVPAPGRKLAFSDVKQLAGAFGLLQETPPNIHLGFLDGDISYWQEQGLTESRLKLEFGARRAVLDAAERQGLVIKDQGTLSWAAQQIMAEIIRASNE